MKDVVEETKNLIMREQFCKLEEMPVRVGIIEKGNYYVYVNTDDGGNVPHFHIVDANTRGKQFHCCVKIEKSEYFDHGFKTDKITNSKERKALDSFLREPFQKSKFNGTNWEYIVMIWNMNNSDMDVDEELPQPDYTKLS
jgi:hypothetical protein